MLEKQELFQEGDNNLVLVLGRGELSQKVINFDH